MARRRGGRGSNPGRQPEPESELSRLEMEVMDEVWKLGECSTSEVVEAFVKRRPLAATTVRTVLANLRTKGYVEAVPTVERGLRIKPAVDREPVIRRTLERLRDSLFGGSPRQAIAFLLAAEDISDDELDELGSLIRNRQKENKQAGSNRKGTR